MFDDTLFKQIYTDYHVLVDPNYFGLSSNLKEDTSKNWIIKKINYPDKKPVCITRIEGYTSFLITISKSILDILFQHRYLTNSCSKPIDLTKNTPSAQNVVQTAIYSAFYMGFAEIYLVVVIWLLFLQSRIWS